MDTLQDNSEAIQKAVRALHEGKTVCHATETCYGLACDMRNQEAVTTLFAIKERPEDMPVSALFESIEQAKLFVVWNDLADQLAREHLPGPLTIVLPLREDSGLFATPRGTETVGVRVSPHPVAMELVRAFGGPITTTSANIHGQPAPYSPQEIGGQFHGRKALPAILLDSGPLENRSNSTVVSITGGSIEILRHGPLQF
ncbi:threonylcarbamoyl-AMP synthase [Candidatus Peregrinibacteria bacterium CG10_big_fil_rev_8_21_14_0_10_49_24]|nr:MAG: threonylcarbamoyl-AMP synthase [Candidatus Peregrinibacteria bacterium CG11_big_fil_rev_8_21_14_0_20_49_14]PIR50485.1 MAG: threonylcarbamoyl-AMP synthase [Candidatus Peregrinibacteria bacterium CG10_big_fil_rev_8_21_14_0_10_49_24]PJA67707.1 MAG: threonylcarbamoyl-AMP synthase [Candidatus Peregrinibacteria bacterium CG_4_9_14_3_um_filter_49_12]